MNVLSDPDSQNEIREKIQETLNKIGIPGMNLQFLATMLKDRKNQELVKNIFSNQKSLNKLSHFPQSKRLGKDNPFTILNSENPQSIQNLFSEEVISKLPEILLNPKDKNTIDKKETEEMKEDEKDIDINIDIEKYQNELIKLYDMGFTDELKNIQVLNKCNGNLDKALEILFNSD